LDDLQGGILAQFAQAVLEGGQHGGALDLDKVGVGARYRAVVEDQAAAFLA
jgi:hypothetical protein